MYSKHFCFFILFLFATQLGIAQSQYELNIGWKCQCISKVKVDGSVLSRPSYNLSGWQNAVVPGTVLTTQLANHQIPDPFYGWNKEKIPDIFKVGRDYYTYWFVKDFKETAPTGEEQVWLYMRGVNYAYDVYLNGQRLNKETHLGMFLRATYNITPYMAKDGNNRLAVIVYPPLKVGNPNGGQGGDGMIAHCVTNQYPAGWDWTQPVRDRNTGIWDKVFIEKTGSVRIEHPSIVTLVPGRRIPGDGQQPAFIKVSATLENAGDIEKQGILEYTLGDKHIYRQANIAPHSSLDVQLPDLKLANPELWWPNGYGTPHLYNISLQFVTDDKKVSDKRDITFGVREIQTTWNTKTQSREVHVNGQKIFIKGGNWITPDEMLRTSKERYDQEVAFHRDMNLNLIRVWGGGITERPEFYDACDKYGLLVFQDFWTSGDCNGRWDDSLKAEDTLARRAYPDDHKLFLESMADQVKMLRNHPSLAFWCGGNETALPDDINKPFRDSILPLLDNTRFYFESSNADSMSLNAGDGPYTIQHIDTFWKIKTFGFNSEVGSVGLGDYESLQRFIPQEHLQKPPVFFDDTDANRSVADTMWYYHRYIGYDGFVDKYGPAKDVRDFAWKAQLVNYDQYRGIIEGISAHMWDWYTGTIIWKTQNPWTAMRGQMYDQHLDPNAGMFGLKHASEPLHIMYNPVDSEVIVVNNGFEAIKDLRLTLRTFYNPDTIRFSEKTSIDIGPGEVHSYISMKNILKLPAHFISLQLSDKNGKLISNNFYWLSDSNGFYPWLKTMKRAEPEIKAHKLSATQVAVTITNYNSRPLAFFNRLSLVDIKSKKRLLPVSYSDNYVTILPGEEKTIIIEYKNLGKAQAMVSIMGWNLPERFIPIK